MNDSQSNAGVARGHEGNYMLNNARAGTVPKMQGKYMLPGARTCVAVENTSKCMHDSANTSAVLGMINNEYGRCSRTVRGQEYVPPCERRCRPELHRHIYAPLC